MINDQSLSAIEEARWHYKGRTFCPPLYDSYCFSKIPGTLKCLLGLEAAGLPRDCYVPGRYDSVIVILLDGFGWELLQKNRANYPFLSRFFNDGIVSKLTSQFPSTTAAHITTLCTDREVGQTGIYEWYMYEPKLGRVMAPLLFSLAGGGEAGSLKIGAEEVLPHDRFFEGLQRQGVLSSTYQHSTISDSIYSRWMFQGSKRVSYKKLQEGLSTLAEQVENGGLFYFYFGDIDTTCHHRGLDSSSLKKTMDSCFLALEQFWEKLSLVKTKTAVIVTADHGMMPISPKTTYFLNKEIPGAAEWFSVGKDGNLLTPAGSCRDYFLHLKQDKVDVAHRQLEEALKERAVIFKTEELIQKGFFSSKPVSSAFLQRVGNLVILPDDEKTVWWYEKDKFDQKFFAMHGGLSPREMETSFLFLAL
jgi:predicted AlkP superfamily pyrophosphatase or phosphodiesterase